MLELSPLQMQRLAGAPVGHLATASQAGGPHVIPVCFVLDSPEDGAVIYIALDGKPKRAALTRLRRVRNILENPQVSLVADHYDADWTKLWYILLTGTAELLEGDYLDPGGSGTFEPANAAGPETAHPEPVEEHADSQPTSAHPELVEGRNTMDERRRAIRLLRQKYPQYREMDIDENPVIKITPARVVAWSYTPETGP